MHDFYNGLLILFFLQLLLLMMWQEEYVQWVSTAPMEPVTQYHVLKERLGVKPPYQMKRHVSSAQQDYIVQE